MRQPPRAFGRSAADFPPGAMKIASAHVDCIEDAANANGPGGRDGAHRIGGYLLATGRNEGRMHINWDSIDAQLKSANAQEADAIHARFAAKAGVRREMRDETADIAAALVGLGQRLAAAEFQVVARATMPDYWVRVGDHSVGIQVSLAAPSWLVMNDGVQSDEIIHVVDGERSFWARAAAANVGINLTSYFAAQFVAFVTRVQAEEQHDNAATPSSAF
jgi:hypothetical protein